MFARLFLCTFMVSVAARAAPAMPVQIPYTGYLQQNGVPATTPVSMTAKLFASATATSALWTGVYSSVPLNNGRFSIVLGDDPSNPILLSDIYSTIKGSVPLQLELTVGNAVLSPRQLVYPAPYANSAAGAGDFTVNNALNAGSLFGFGSVGARLVEIWDNLTVHGNLTATGTVHANSDVSAGGNVTATGHVSATGQVVAGGGLKPDVDTGWFEVWSDNTRGHPPASPGITSADGTNIYRDTYDIMISHSGNKFIPTRVVIQGCSHIDPNTKQPTGLVTNFGGFGYRDDGQSINPVMSYASNDSTFVLAMYNGWPIWRYYQNQTWVCPTDAPNGANCVSGYYRVLLWR